MTALSLRRDLVTGRRVLVAPARRGSPRDFGAIPLARDASQCPFCPGHESATSETRAERVDRSTGTWIARAFSNLFPMVHPEATTGAFERPTEDALAARGDHEVIVETPSHDVDLGALSDDHARAVFDLYRERYRGLAARDDARAMLLFKNRGPRAGASLRHAHGQVLSVPIVPPGVRRRDAISRKHHETIGKGALAEARDRELAAEVRMVERSARYAVFCPFAPHRSFETWIVPMTPVASLAQVDDASLDELAPLIVRTLNRVLRATGDADYNLVLRAPALRHWSAPWALWNLEILPRRGGDAGFELSTEMQCVLTPPEESAQVLRAL